MSACGLCQDRTSIAWSVWQTNCTQGVAIKTFPNPIPPGTAVPGWAYLDVVGTDEFDPAVAQQLAQLPESTAEAGSPTAAAPPQAAPSGSNTNSGGGYNAPAGGKKKSNAGPIAGGVVGGVVVIALIALLVFFLVRRKNKKRDSAGGVQPILGSEKPYSPPSTPFNGYQPAQQYPYDQHQQHADPYGGIVSPVPAASPRLYDPSDPSTYPATASQAQLTQQSNWSSHQTHQRPGAYSGAPEL